jgi:hypothetical protein
MHTLMMLCKPTTANLVSANDPPPVQRPDGPVATALRGHEMKVTRTFICLQREEPTRSGRFALIDLTANTMALGLDRLEIEHPEQM